MRSRLVIAAWLTWTTAAACLVGVDAQALRLQVDLCSVPTHIVVATVLSRESRWQEHGNGGEIIVSDVHLDVHRVIEGPPSASLTLRVKGGTVGKTKMGASDAPRLDVGSQYLLFLPSNLGDGLSLIYDYRELGDVGPLPDDAALRKIWAALCDAYPAGFPPGSVTRAYLEEATRLGVPIGSPLIQGQPTAPPEPPPPSPLQHGQ